MSESTNENQVNMMMSQSLNQWNSNVKWTELGSGKTKTMEINGTDRSKLTVRTNLQMENI